MPASNTIPEPWRSFLQELDRLVTMETRLDCMGGFVMTQFYGFSRETSDLDVLVITPSEQGSILLKLAAQGTPLHKKHRVYLDHAAIANVPENYEDRLTEMYAGLHKRLRICALDPYDLALSKLERNIQRDRDDVKHLARHIPLDLEILQDRYEKEMRIFRETRNAKT